MTVLFAIGIGTALLDFFFLAGVASFLLSMAGVTSTPILWLGKVAVPLLVVGYELTAAGAEKKRPRSFTYLFPAIVATFATATYVAHEGITSLDAITPIHWFMVPAVFGFGFMLHYLAICLAPYAIDGMTIATDLRQGFAYHKKRQNAEKAIDLLCLKVLAWLEAYRVLKHDHGIDTMPPFYLLPALTRQLFNEKVGYSFFPDPPAASSGDGATSPPSWTTPRTPDEGGWNSSNSY